MATWRSSPRMGSRSMSKSNPSQIKYLSVKDTCMALPLRHSCSTLSHRSRHLTQILLTRTHRTPVPYKSLRSRRSCNSMAAAQVDFQASIPVADEPHTVVTPKGASGVHSSPQVPTRLIWESCWHAQIFNLLVLHFLLSRLCGCFAGL